MPAYGYSSRVVNEHDLLELKEVTFSIPLADLRRIAEFLHAFADNVQNGRWKNDHRHLQDFDRAWRTDHPDFDVIAIHPDPPPPLRAG